MSTESNREQEQNSSQDLSRSTAQHDLDIVKSELMAAQASRIHLAAEVARIATECAAIERERKQTLHKLKKRTEECGRLSATLKNEREELAAVQKSLEDALNTLEQERQVVRSVEQSVSWKVTKPFRDFMRFLRGQTSIGAGR